MVIDLNQQLGFAIEATPETDPINALDALYWKFGRRPFEMKDLHPIETKKWVPRYKADSRMPNTLTLVSSDIGKGVTFQPVNGIPEYLVLGNSSTDGTPKHTITALTSGALPTITVRSESTEPGASNDKIWSVTGCKARTLNIHLEMPPLGTGTLVSSLAYDGIKNITPSLDQRHTTGVLFPTTDGTMTANLQVSDQYTYGINASGFVFTWNATAYKNELIILDSLINMTRPPPIHVDAQVDPEYIYEGAYNLPITFQLWRGTDKTIYTDFLAGTKRTLTFRIYSGGSTNYKEYTWSNVALTQCDANYFMDEDKPIWDVQGLATSVSVVARDGLPKAIYYGE